MNTSKILNKHPIIITVTLSVLLIIATYTYDFIPFHFYFDMVLYRIGLCGNLIFLMYKLKLLNTLRFSFKSFGYGFFCSGIFLIFAIYVFIMNLLSADLYMSIGVVDFVFRMLMVGIMEELIFRGAILNVIIKNSKQTTADIYKAVFISSLLFGLCHAFNIINTPFLDVLNQVYLTICVGVMLSAIYIRCKSIWFCSFLHALWNSAHMIGNTIFKATEEAAMVTNSSMTLVQYLSSFIEPTLFLLFGLFLLRKLHKPEFIQDFTTTFNQSC